MPLDDRFWEEEDKQSERELVGLYILLLLYGISGGASLLRNPNMTEEKVIDEIIAKVDQFRADLAGINSTTRKRVEKIVEKWGEIGADALVLSAMLAPVFSEQRLEFISVTEVTKAVNAGNIIAWKESVDEMEWRTSEDGRVCPECNARNGNIYPADSADAPPLHPGCRCWLTPVERKR